MLKIKRAYEEPEAGDGHRVLVDRLWPRGIGREELKVDNWLKDLAPTAELRKWFGHDAERWMEFARRYRKELSDAKNRIALRDLMERAAEEPVTLVFAARDEAHNNAVVLLKKLQGMLSARRKRTGGSHVRFAA